MTTLVKNKKIINITLLFIAAFVAVSLLAYFTIKCRQIEKYEVKRKRKNQKRNCEHTLSKTKFIKKLHTHTWKETSLQPHLHKLENNVNLLSKIT